MYNINFYFLLTEVNGDILTQKAMRLDIKSPTQNLLFPNILFIFHGLGGAFSHTSLIRDVAPSQQDTYQHLQIGFDFAYVKALFLPLWLCFKTHHIFQNEHLPDIVTKGNGWEILLFFDTVSSWNELHLFY